MCRRRIAALDAVWRARFGGRYVPCLWGGRLGSGLCLRWLDGGWVELSRFAAVRKHQ